MSTTPDQLDLPLVEPQTPVPCHHCGCARIDVWFDDEDYFQAICLDCGACGPRYDHTGAEGCPQEAAFRAWNRRAGPMTDCAVCDGKGGAWIAWPPPMRAFRWKDCEPCEGVGRIAV